MSTQFRSGFVALMGRPNTGKSTLLNALVGEKVAITSKKAQTTRTNIRGVLTADDHQIVFVDTPGIHKPRTALGERLNQTATRASGEVDLIVFVIDAAQPVGRGDKFVADQVTRAGARAICVVNKIDSVSKQAVFQQLEAAATLAEFEEIIPVSAREGLNVGKLHRLILERLEPGPAFFPEDMRSDQQLEFQITELIREKALWLLHEEVPHSVAVGLDEMTRREEDDVLEIHASIYVERDSQKGIVIGKGGSMLRDISTRARRELERLLGEHCYLRCQVKVRKDWQQHASEVERMGY
jgi:GTP-binding protein Era